MPEIDMVAFYKTIANELDTIKDRVRNLIGNSNWGEDGRYKEAILRTVIKRFLPKNFSIGTGFVLNHYLSESHITSQIDIVVYDNSYPTLFQEGDFVVLTPQSVRAIIEVKTAIKTYSDLKNIARKIIKDALLIRKNQGKECVVNQNGIPEEKPLELFVGLFSYNFERAPNNVNLTWIKDIFCDELKEKNHTHADVEKYFINNVVLSKDIYIQLNKLSSTELNLTLYEMNDLAQAYFITSLLESLNFLSIYSSYGAWFPFNTEAFTKKKINFKNV